MKYPPRMSVDDLQRHDAKRFNLRVLRRVLCKRSAIWKEASDKALAERVQIIVENAEAGTLDDHDSRVLGDYAVAILRECMA
jgi:hypothetical protein